MREKSFNHVIYPNGFQLAWQRTPTKTIFTNLRINHGSLHEQPGEEGIAHFLEHMFIEGGTRKFTPKEQAIMRDDFGYTNAATSRYQTRVLWGMTPEDFEKYLDITNEMVFHPRLDPEVLAQQKEIVLREIAKQRGAPSFEDINGFYWPTLTRSRDHSQIVIGEENVIKNATEEQLRAFHARGYSPHNMVLMISGDVPRNIEETVGRYFADAPKGPGKQWEFTPVSPLEEKTVRHSKADDLLDKQNPKGSNSQIMFGCIVPDEFHPDSAHLQVATEVMGRSRNTGLKRRIRTEEGLAYEINGVYSGDKRMGRIELSGKVLARKQERALDIMFEELQRIKQTPFDEEEITRAKRRVAYKTFNKEGGSFRKFINIDPVNIGVIINIDYEFDNRVPIQEKIAALDTVTPESVREASMRYLPSDKENDNYVLLIRDPLKE